jgi:hypothetical protein
MALLTSGNKLKYMHWLRECNSFVFRGARVDMTMKYE